MTATHTPYSPTPSGPNRPPEKHKRGATKESHPMGSLNIGLKEGITVKHNPMNVVKRLGSFGMRHKIVAAGLVATMTGMGLAGVLDDDIQWAGRTVGVGIEAAGTGVHNTGDWLRRWGSTPSVSEGSGSGTKVGSMSLSKIAGLLPPGTVIPDHANVTAGNGNGQIAVAEAGNPGLVKRLGEQGAEGILEATCVVAYVTKESPTVSFGEHLVVPVLPSNAGPNTPANCTVPPKP